MHVIHFSDETVSGCGRWADYKDWDNTNIEVIEYDDFDIRNGESELTDY